MMDNTNMGAKAVQISIDQRLLERVDRDPQTKKEGRSAFVRDAIELYLATKRRRDTDAKLAAVFRDGTAARELLEEVEVWTKVQAWPKK